VGVVVGVVEGADAAVVVVEALVDVAGVGALVAVALAALKVRN
jgi:hypothetical protein